MNTDRQAILDLVRKFANQRTPAAFVPGTSAVPPSGKVIGAAELVNMVDACLDGWLTADRFNTTFEQKLADFIGCRFVRTVNSGSSANLVAVAALTSPLLGEKALQRGDEVITVAAGFPTTVNPLLLYGLVPVFVDVALPSYNIDADLIEAAITPKTRAIMLAHTLGIPFDIERVMAIARKHNLWVIEDCCDALGATYKNQHVGTFGHIGTLSFYPAHQITTGEGGAVFTSDETLRRIIESVRDWGRDCWCAPGSDNTCGRRYCWKLGQLPEGYDHKYIYSHLGYNLKITDIQAACGAAQVDQLPAFVAARRRNFDYLARELADLDAVFILPAALPDSQPSWFGFPLTIQPQAGFGRVELLRYLEQKRVGSRLLFGGNLTQQPYFAGQNYRISGTLPVTNTIMNNTFWLGTYPGLSTEQLRYTTETLRSFCGVGW